MSADSKNIHIIYFTSAGGRLAERIADGIAEVSTVTDGRGGTAGEWTRQYFCRGNILVFIGAAGIAVRMIAPLIEAKDRDPGVLVIDERGQYVIPILSGHVGGANECAVKIAGLIGASPVLTTASDVNGLFAVDTFAAKNGLVPDDPKKVKRFAARVVEDKRAAILIPEAAARITPFAEDDPDVLTLVPRCVVIGMGCRKGKGADELYAFLDEVLRALRLNPASVRAIASIDVKREEKGLIELADRLGVPFLTFTVEELEKTGGRDRFSDSERVRQAVGTGNVCERAAAAAGAVRFLLRKTSMDGMTVCVGIAPQKLEV